MGYSGASVICQRRWQDRGWRMLDFITPPDWSRFGFESQARHCSPGARVQQEWRKKTQCGLV